MTDYKMFFSLSLWKKGKDGTKGNYWWLILGRILKYCFYSLISTRPANCRVAKLLKQKGCFISEGSIKSGKFLWMAFKPLFNIIRLFMYMREKHGVISNRIVFRETRLGIDRNTQKEYFCNKKNHRSNSISP